MSIFNRNRRWKNGKKSNDLASTLLNKLGRRSSVSVNQVDLVEPFIEEGRDLPTSSQSRMPLWAKVITGAVFIGGSLVVINAGKEEGQRYISPFINSRDTSTDILPSKGDISREIELDADFYSSGWPDRGKRIIFDEDSCKRIYSSLGIKTSPPSKVEVVLGFKRADNLPRENIVYLFSEEKDFPRVSLYDAVGKRSSDIDVDGVISLSRGSTERGPVIYSQTMGLGDSYLKDLKEDVFNLPSDSILMPIESTYDVRTAALKDYSSKFKLFLSAAKDKNKD